MLCLSINMKFGPAHKPESERALWPAASSGGAWNSLLGSEPLERRDLDRFGCEGVVVVFCLLKDRPYALTPEMLGCVLDFSAAKDRPGTRFGSCVTPGSGHKIRAVLDRTSTGSRTRVPGSKTAKLRMDDKRECGSEEP